MEGLSGPYRLNLTWGRLKDYFLKAPIFTPIVVLECQQRQGGTVSKKRITTTTVTHEVIVIKNSAVALSTLCRECGDQSRMVTLEQAMAIAGVSSRTVYRWVESSSIHYFETPEGFILICLNSLAL